MIPYFCTMQTLEGIQSQIQDFFERNVSEQIISRGRQYFKNGQVVDDPTLVAENKLLITVIGSELYDVEIDLDPTGGKSIAGDIVTTDEGVLKKLKKEDLIGLFG